MQDLRTAALEDGGLLDRAVARAVEGTAEPAPAPVCMRLLLRRYAMGGRDELEDGLGPALARALDLSVADEAGRAAWLVLFAEAATLSRDERLVSAVRRLAALTRNAWPHVSGAADAGVVASAMPSIDACLRAADLEKDETAVHTAIAGAVDELERVISARYRPGSGLTRSDGGAGNLLDHVRAATALVTAHARTGRLPYAMLAEELMHAVRPSLVASVTTDFAAACEAAGVLSRIAALHADAAYLEAAVVAPDADYAADAAGLLQALGVRLFIGDADPTALAPAEYGLALCEWLALDVPGCGLEAP